jgi:hypothetical protein
MTKTAQWQALLAFAPELAAMAPALLGLIGEGAGLEALLGAAEAGGMSKGAVDALSKIGDVGKIGELLKKVTGDDVVANWKKLGDPGYHLENTLPGLIGGAGAAEMLAHGNETFDTKTYKDMYDYMEGKTPSSKDRSVFKNDTVKSPENPYGRAKVSAQKIDSSPAGQLQQLSRMLPDYNMPQIEAALKNIVESNTSRGQKQAQVTKLLNNINKDLAPVKMKLIELGIIKNESK